MVAKHGSFGRIGSRTKLLLLAALAVTPGCPPTHGARISLGAEVRSPVVAMDGSGNGTLVWIEAWNQGTEYGKVASANYDRDSGLRVSRVIYDKSSSRSPVVVMDTRGLAYAAWEAKPSGNQSAVMVTEKSMQALHWTSPVELYRTSYEELSPVSLATSAAGDRLLAFGVTPDADPVRWQVLASASSSDAPWAAPFVLAEASIDDADEVSSPDRLDVHAAINAAGVGAVVYNSFLTGSVARVVHRFEPGSDPLVPEQVDEGGVDAVAFEGSALFVTSDGVILVFWVAIESGSGESGLWSRAHRPGLGWDPPQKLAQCDDSDTQLLTGGVDAIGNALISFQTTSSFNEHYSEPYAWSPLGGWSGPLAGFPSLSVGTPELSFAADASAIVVGAPSPHRLHPSATFMDAAGAWSPPRAFGTTRPAWTKDHVPSAIDGSGTSMCAWTTDDGLQFQVWRAPAADFSIDGPPPIAGEKETLDAAATRIWTTDGRLVKAEWDLDGDGLFDVTDDLPADGLLASWIWTAARTWSVTLRVTDDWGGVGVVTQDVEVGDGSGGGGGPPWRLLVLDSGGSGVVTSNLDSDDDGTPDIVTPGDREEFYADGPSADDHAQVVLTQVADLGFAFDHWEGLDLLKYHDVDLGANGCLVQVLADRTITAAFVPLSP